MEEVSYLHDLYAQKQTEYAQKIEKLNEKVIYEDEKAEELRDGYKEFKRRMSRNAINPRTGKPIPPKVYFMCLFFLFVYLFSDIHIVIYKVYLLYII